MNCGFFDYPIHPAIRQFDRAAGRIVQSGYPVSAEALIYKIFKIFLPDTSVHKGTEVDSCMMQLVKANHGLLMYLLRHAGTVARAFFLQRSFIDCSIALVSEDLTSADHAHESYGTFKD